MFPVEDAEYMIMSCPSLSPSNERIDTPAPGSAEPEPGGCSCDVEFETDVFVVVVVVFLTEGLRSSQLLLESSPGLRNGVS